jgi:SAM-dependent methyltransferase
MDIPPRTNPGLGDSFRAWWTENLRQKGFLRTFLNLLGKLWLFLRDSTPEQRRRRYGDVEYDWEHGVNTTSATVTWRDRLLGVLHSPYQPTEPALLHEMLETLPIDFSEFTFIDLGSGKGRTLLMASDYPFRRIVGVELLPELNRVALENMRDYSNPSQKCFALKTICADARNFEFPAEPTVLYLFNPLPESGLVTVIRKLEQSLLIHPRPAFVLYHNPLLEHVLSRSTMLNKIGGTRQYSVFSNAR